MARLTIDEARRAGIDVGAAGAPARASKFGAKRTEAIDGVVYASKAEANRAAELTMMRDGGVVLEFVRQPRFLLPDKASVYLADFLVVWAPGREHGGEHAVTVEDVKGARTPKFEADVGRWRLHGRLPLVILSQGTRGWKYETIMPEPRRR